MRAGSRPASPTASVAEKAPSPSRLGDTAAASPGDRLLNATLALGILMVFALVVWMDPAASGLFPECPFRAITGGIHCPGCGTLRAIHQLSRGEFSAAFLLNPLAILFLPMVVFGLVRALFPKHLAWWPRLSSPRLGWAMLGIVLAWWVIRNIVGTAA